LTTRPSSPIHASSITRRSGATSRARKWVLFGRMLRYCFSTWTNNSPAEAKKLTPLYPLRRILIASCSFPYAPELNTTIDRSKPNNTVSIYFRGLKEQENSMNFVMFGFLFAGLFKSELQNRPEWHFLQLFAWAAIAQLTFPTTKLIIYTKT